MIQRVMANPSSLNPRAKFSPAAQKRTAPTGLKGSLTPEPQWRKMFPNQPGATPAPTPTATPPTPAPVPRRTTAQARQPQTNPQTDPRLDPNKQTAMSAVNMSRAGRDAARAERAYDQRTPGGQGGIGATAGGTGLTPDDAWRKWFPTPGTKPDDEKNVSQSARTDKRVAAMAPGAAAPAPAMAAVTPPTPTPPMSMNPAMAAATPPAEDGLQPTDAMRKTTQSFSRSLNPANAVPGSAPTASAPVAQKQDDDTDAA